MVRFQPGWKAFDADCVCGRLPPLLAVAVGHEDRPKSMDHGHETGDTVLVLHVLNQLDPATVSAATRVFWE